MRISSQWKRRGGSGSAALAAPLSAGAIGPDLIEAFVFGGGPVTHDRASAIVSDSTVSATGSVVSPPSGAATWYTPTAPFQVTPNSAPYQYYQCTLAWSHRYAVNELDYPRAMERVVVADHGWLNVQGDNDDDGLNMTGFVESWGWSSASFTWAESGFFDPDVTGNYVLLWDQAGGLSSGHYAQLWRNGTLVGYVTTQIPDYGLSNLRLLGDGSTPLPGETQGFWWSNDTAMDPATMFAELFDGANGMLDLNADPTIDGVTPDNYYMEPGAGGSTFDRTAEVVSDSTVTASATKTTASATAISSDSTVAAVGQRIQQRTVAVQSDSAVSATGTLTQVRSASVQSDTTVTAASTLTITRSSAIQSDSTVSAEAQGDIPRSATIQSDSTVSAVGNLTITRAAAIQSDSALTAAALGQIDRAASIASDSTITAAWIRILDRAASIQSDGALSATAAAASVHVLPRVIAAVHPGRMMCR